MSEKVTINLVNAPVHEGASQLGCNMGPDSLRVAGLVHALEGLGHSVIDMGTPVLGRPDNISHPNEAVHNLSDITNWTRAIQEVGKEITDPEILPIFLGGDHSIALGSVPAMAQRAKKLNKPLFVLWLDAHPDFHRLETTKSGNLHGTPVAYFTGQAGFDGYFPKLSTTVNPENVCMMGIRSADAAERQGLAQAGITVHDMRAIDETGVAALLKPFLAQVSRARGHLHVSLDVDFLDPGIAPAVGTTVPGGATFREAHLIMELLHDSALTTSLDIVELNPFLDERGRTAKLMVDLTASLMGRSVLDRPTQSF